MHACAPQVLRGVKETELFAFGECGSALFDVPLMLEAARDGLGITGCAASLAGSACEGGISGAIATVGCGRGVRIVGVAGTQAVRVRCAGDDARLENAASAYSVMRELLEAAGAAPDSGADVLGAGDSKLMTLGRKPEGCGACCAASRSFGTSPQLRRH